jgi:ABC-2 type transport system permease protein
MIGKLISINLQAFLSRSRKSTRSPARVSAGRTVLVALLMVYAFGALLFAFWNLAKLLCEPLYSVGLGWFYFALFGILIFALCVLGSIFTMQSQIFSARDNDLLLSMPIKPSAILLGRLFMILIEEYALTVLVAAPALAVWCLAGLATPVGAVCFLLAILFLPLLSTAVACLLAWAIALLTSRMRRKNVITIALSLAFFAAYFWFYTNLSRYMQALIERGAEIADAVRKSFPPIYLMGDAIYTGNVRSMALFMLCCAAPFALMVFLLSRNFTKIVTTNRGAKKIAYREKPMKSSTVAATLLKKELRHYVSKPVFILNMSLNSIFAIGVAVFAVIKRADILMLFDALGVITDSVSPAVLVCLVLLALATMGTASASLISLEGKNLWIARSIPVPSRDILLSKVNLHLTLSVPPFLLASLVCAWAVSASLLQTALIVVLPLVFTLFMALLGTVLNLLMPKFDFVSEVVPVKQGAPVMLVMFGGMAIVATLAAVYALLLADVLSADAYIALVSALLSAVDALLYAYLVTAGGRRFEGL